MAAGYEKIWYEGRNFRNNRAKYVDADGNDDGEHSESADTMDIMTEYGEEHVSEL